MPHELDALQKALDYRFRNPHHLREALQHRSFVNESPQSDLRDNETLEFLGDAVLNLVVGHVLMQRHPEMNEGALSRTRAQLVSEVRLAEVARTIELGRFVKLGRGEIQTGGRKKPSILADTLEAVLAAVYLDGGYQAAFDVIASRLAFQFEDAGTAVADTDYKSRLQEYAQNHLQTMPVYRVVDARGPDHDKVFKVELLLQRSCVHGTGRSKKTAEQDAARQALQALAGTT
ncbi:MAG: ribonuclease III [Desulfobacterales bacterium]|nr:ribonuclease III [Desulfobacterales bacterium]MDJ0855453.1 ribonuclease III [Desulfobacterales bacterium]MDJ0886290.1 ribonuclease III [Desulfobacterales bacterium]MDJ0988855.1 ribonuclease III [Desulfobacterales bacterium]